MDGCHRCCLGCRELPWHACCRLARPDRLQASLHQALLLKGLEHAAAKSKRAAEFGHGHGLLLALEVIQQRLLGCAHRRYRPGVIRGSRGGADAPDRPWRACRRLPALAQPAGGEGGFEGFKEAGVGLPGHVLEQRLPGVIHGGALQHPLNRLDGFAEQRGRTGRQRLHNQTRVRAPLQPHLHQIACAKRDLAVVGIGEDLALTASFKPDLEPLA